MGVAGPSNRSCGGRTDNHHMNTPEPGSPEYMRLQMEAVDRDLAEHGIEYFLTPANGGPPIRTENHHMKSPELSIPIVREGFVKSVRITAVALDVDGQELGRTERTIDLTLADNLFGVGAELDMGVAWESLDPQERSRIEHRRAAEDTARRITG